MLVSSSGFSAARGKASPSNNITIKSPKPFQSNKPKKSVGQAVRVRPFPLKKHRRGKRNCLKLFQKNFKWIGNNIAGARSKWGSLKRWVRLKNPAILSLQETKFQVAGKHRLDGYITYEHLRTVKTAGGGILMAVLQELSPALVRDGGEFVEAITVDINVKKMQIVCTSAYGPQEKDSLEKKTQFWDYLDEHAKRADLEGKGFILQGDLNSWLGKLTLKKTIESKTKMAS